jgi:hypothetical protein
LAIFPLLLNFSGKLLRAWITLQILFWFASVQFDSFQFDSIRFRGPLSKVKRLILLVDSAPLNSSLPTHVFVLLLCLLADRSKIQIWIAVFLVRWRLEGNSRSINAETEDWTVIVLRWMSLFMEWIPYPEQSWIGWNWTECYVNLRLSPKFPAQAPSHHPSSFGSTRLNHLNYNFEDPKQEQIQRQEEMTHMWGKISTMIGFGVNRSKDSSAICGVHFSMIRIANSSSCSIVFWTELTNELIILSINSINNSFVKWHLRACRMMKSSFSHHPRL